MCPRTIHIRTRLGGTIYLAERSAARAQSPSNWKARNKVSVSECAGHAIQSKLAPSLCSSKSPSDQSLCPAFLGLLYLPLPTRIGSMLRSDTSTALLDRNCKSQLLGSCSGHRGERYVFKFRTYLKKTDSRQAPPHRGSEICTVRTSTNSSTSTSFCLANPVSSSTYSKSLVLMLA